MNTVERPRPGKREGRDETEPLPREFGALEIHAGADDADTVLHRIAGHMRTFEFVEHRMVGPFDRLVRIVAIDLDPVEIADMLHVGRVGAQHPGIDGHFLAEDLGLEHQILVREFEIGQLVMRLQPVEGPENAIFLAHREFEQPRRAGDRIPCSACRCTGRPARISNGDRRSGHCHRPCRRSRDPHPDAGNRRS
jgi:hypothetical protein